MAADRMRILMTADTIGGVWTFAMELCAQLCARGDRVLLAAMGRDPDPAQRIQAAAIPGLTLCARPYRLVWMAEPGSDLRAAGAWLRQLAREFRPDVVHLNDLALADLDWRRPVLVSAHSCVCSWWRAVHGEAAPASWSRYRRRVAATLRAADRVIAPTQAMLDALTREHGVLPATQVVHNGRGAVAHRAGKEAFVFSAGRLWDEAKNLGTLARIAPRVPWPIHIAGDARHPDEDSATRFDNVRMLGALGSEEVREHMARAAIYAMPARYEPFGLSALEAAQARCALVLGDVPSLREIWGDAALFVPPNDPDALEAALHRLIHDDALRGALAQKAHRRAGRYTPEAMAGGYRSAYAELIARHRGQSRSVPILDAQTGAHP
ncbi:glycosyltransferase family 4 protein [Lysobacter arvi]|uniref:Glycosyltransferase family 4 protein n=1 Tax=Lysobacter arvi TaxID=3038776 RepID=A0ABU1CBT0_9GAMM|nr:glycosyltransferase family 4 protein [Lysobacter arvi]MDR0182622.1 glycosyltransferase family 4 protein [Lysobacter arvi]